MRRGGRAGGGKGAGWAKAAGVLLLGLAGAAASAAEPGAGDRPADVPKTNWWASLLGGPDRVEEKKEKPEAEEEGAVPRSSRSDLVAREKDRQWRALNRRLQVCDQLKQIAADTNNVRLEQEAIELESRAFEIYRRQTEKLAAGGPSRLDEESLGRDLGTGSARPSKGDWRGEVGGDFRRTASLREGTR